MSNKTAVTIFWRCSIKEPSSRTGFFILSDVWLCLHFEFCSRTVESLPPLQTRGARGVAGPRPVTAPRCLSLVFGKCKVVFKPVGVSPVGKRRCNRSLILKSWPGKSNKTQSGHKAGSGGALHWDVYGVWDFLIVNSPESRDGPRSH